MKNIIERSAVILLILLSTGAGMGIFIGRDATVAASAGGEPVIQAIFGLVYLVLLVFIGTRIKSVLSLVYQEKWIALICACCLISTFWSIEPSETFRRSLALIGISMAGLFIGMKYEPKQQIKMLAACLGIAAIASLLAGLIAPGIGTVPDGAWQGVFYLKNSLARMMTLGALCFALLAIGQRRFRMISIAMIVLCFTLLFLSKSVTGAVVSVFLFAFLPFRRVLLWNNRRLIALMVVVALLAVPLGLWLMGHAVDILYTLNRDPTLTGRLPLWHFVKQEILTRPMLGFGFSAFWSGSEAARIQSVVNWDAPNAHNGFLETRLGIGWVGLGILLISLAANFLRSVRAAREEEDFGRWWPFMFFMFLVLYSFTESSLLSVNSVLWLMYSANSYWLVRAGLRAHEVREEDPESPEPIYSPALNPGPIAS